jgi:hypothetical protein
MNMPISKDELLKQFYEVLLQLQFLLDCRGPRISRIPYKSGQFFGDILFVVKKLLVKNILRTFFTTRVF